MKLRSILCGVLAIAAAVACKPDDVVETPKLDVDKTAVSVTAEAGQATFNVTTNQDWTASADADWVSVNPNNGKASDKAVAVKVTAEDNATEAERTATVTVKAGTLSKTVKVTQAAKTTTPEPPVDEPEFEVKELYMLGSACDTGWSLDEMQAFANDGGIFTWTGNLNSEGEFRFPLQKVSNQWWPCLMISADGKSLVYGTSDDEKVIYNVPETGNYTITIDARDVKNMAVEVVYNGPVTEGPEVSWGLMGCFVDNLWATDVPMTKEGEWIVAKGAQFTELTFKIRGNASWNDKHNMGYAPGTEKGLVNARLAVVTAEYSKANLGGDCVDIKLNGEPGTYDVYFSFENLEVYVMEQGYKPGEREPIQVEPQEVTYTVVGTIADHPWENNYEGGLMAADGEYLVAKNVPLVWNSTCYGGDYNRIEFKIVETGTWDGYAYPEKNVDQQANTEIQVSVGGENIALDAPEGNYDVYFDKANTKVWVMEPGLKPGGSAPADVDIDGKQWVFSWQAMGGAQFVIDLGVTQPGTGILAYDMGVLDPSYAGIYYPYMVGAYSIVKTDGTSGVLTLSAEGVSVDIPYSNATENSVHFAAAVLIEEDVDCTLATTPITINLETAQGLADGEYWIIADGKVATPLTSEYGYLQVVDAVDGRSTAANAFTFTQVEDGLYTIQDSNGKFYYQTGSYDSFNIADEDGMTDEFLWEVYDTGNGQYAIINYEAGKHIQYNAAYTSYGSYMDEIGTLPTLVLADNPVADEPVTPEMPEIPADYTAATLWEGSLEMAWGTGMQALAYGGYNWANCEVGQYLKVSVTPTDPSADWTVQILYADEEYDWAGIDFLPDFKNVEEIVVELTEELLALFAAPNNGLIIQGDNATATKVELYRKPAGAAGYALTMTNATEGQNWSTQVWYTLDEPLKAGAQYEFKCVAKSTVARDWCSIFLQSADGNDQNYNHGMNLSTEWTPTTLTINPDKDTYTKLTFNIGDFIGTVSLDNVSLKEVGSDVELIKNGDFENGTTAGWGSWTGAEGVGEGYAGN